MMVPKSKKKFRVYVCVAVFVRLATSRPPKELHTVCGSVYGCHRQLKNAYF
jgi:hypothetical protein